MNKFPDHFSHQANLYARFRPQYPKELYAFITRHVQTKNRVWDCGTGNGQAAKALSQYFSHVHATDPSEQQLKSAQLADQIVYRVATAEDPPFPDQYFDLITVAQALHWFKFPAFFAQVKRLLKPEGILAVWGYQLLRINPDLDPCLQHFYTQVVGPYWPQQRKHIDNAYADIPFPFPVLEVPTFSIDVDWDLAQLCGYLRTWSSVKAYVRATANDPVGKLEKELGTIWSNPLTKRKIVFPIFLKMARL
ncbi:MAG: class I SAM-dependent methyltransferase [Bacteroidota bacterium]